MATIEELKQSYSVALQKYQDLLELTKEGNKEEITKEIGDIYYSLCIMQMDALKTYIDSLIASISLLAKEKGNMLL